MLVTLSARDGCLNLQRFLVAEIPKFDFCPCVKLFNSLENSERKICEVRWEIQEEIQVVGPGRIWDSNGTCIRAIKKKDTAKGVKKWIHLAGAK